MPTECAAVVTADGSAIRVTVQMPTDSSNGTSNWAAGHATYTAAIDEAYFAAIMPAHEATYKAAHISTIGEADAATFDSTECAAIYTA